jgi:hypothetical protein
MPATVREVLMLCFFILPTGQLPEEAQEARNKNLKRLESMTHEKHSGSVPVHTLFIFSDLVISSLRNLEI